MKIGALIVCKNLHVGDVMCCSHGAVNNMNRRCIKHGYRARNLEKGEICIVIALIDNDPQFGATSHVVITEQGLIISRLLFDDAEVVK